MRRIVFDDDDDEQKEEPQTSAAEWRALRQALTERVRTLTAERDAAEDEAGRGKLQAQIDEARRQIRALALEEGVAQFTEDAERYVIASGTVREELSRDPDAEIT